MYDAGRYVYKMLVGRYRYVVHNGLMIEVTNLYPTAKSLVSRMKTR